MKRPVTTIHFSVISPSGYHQTENRRLTHSVRSVVLKLGWILQARDRSPPSKNPIARREAGLWSLEVTPESSSSSRTRQQVILGPRSSVESLEILDVSTVHEGKTLTRWRKPATSTLKTRTFGFFVNITILQHMRSSFSVADGPGICQLIYFWTG